MMPLLWKVKGGVLELGNLGGAAQEEMLNEGGTGANQEIIRGQCLIQWEQQVQRPWRRSELATLMEGRGRWDWMGEPGREGKRGWQGGLHPNQSGWYLFQGQWD